MKTNEKVTNNEKEMITKIINKELDGMKSQTITTGEMNNHLGNIIDSIINQTIGKEPEQLPSMKQSEMDINELLVYNELKNYQKEKCFFIDFNLDVTKMVKKAFYVTLIDTGISFVIYKKKDTDLMFLDMLWYETSKVDIDEYISNEENEYVTWVRNYNMKESGMGVILNKFNFVTDEIRCDFYILNSDRTLKLIMENFLLVLP
jgi:hypothetical protein